DQGQDLGFARRVGPPVVELSHASADRHLHLPGDGALGRGTMAEQHDRDPLDDAAIAREPVHGVRDLAAQVRRYSLAVDDFCGHGLPPASFETGALTRPLRTRADERHYPIAQIFSSVAASVAPAPLIRSCLSRALAPATKLPSRTATPRLLAMSFTSAALASPSLAAAAHAHLQYAAPVGELRHAIDGIAAAPRREPDDEHKAARRDAPGRV